jgi:4-amino-4-deoxy-L-arabinose transferase-like glycosyltransferase
VIAPHRALGPTVGSKDGDLTPPSDSGRRFWWWLIALSIVGLCLRVGYLLTHEHLGLLGDGLAYHASGRGAAQGVWFRSLAGEPDTQHPPLWTLILSLISVAGLDSLLRHQITAALIGTSSIAMVGVAGRRIAGERVGVIAAAIATLYPGWWQYERELLSEVVLVPLVALVLLLAYRYRDGPSLIRAVALGAACALVASARSEQALLLVLLVIPVILAARGVSWRSRLAWLVASAVSAAIVLAPWTTYNAARFGRPVVLSTNLGGTMIAGACDTTFSGNLLGSFDVETCVFRNAMRIGNRDRFEADSLRRRFAIEYSLDHLDQLPVVVLAREGRTFGLYRPFQEVQLVSEFGRTPRWVGYAWIFSYWTLIPLGVWGAVLLRRRHVPIYPLLVEFIVIAIATATTIGLMRYRVAAEVPLVILAAVALARAWELLRGHMRPSAAPAVDAADVRPAGS